MSTNATNQRRDPVGRFATQARSETTVDLTEGGADQDWTQVREGPSRDTSDPDDENVWNETTDLRGNADFEARCRALLGVARKNAKVTVTRERGEVNPWGCDTWESFEGIELTCAGRSRTFSDLPELIRVLEHAYEPPLTEERARTLIGRQVDVTTALGGPVRGRVGNANGWQILLCCPPGTRWAGGNDRYVRPDGEVWFWPTYRQILKLEAVEPGTDE